MGSALAPGFRFPSLASLFPANVYFYLNFYYFYNLYDFYCQKNCRDHLSFLLAEIPNLDVSVSAGGVGRIKVTVVGIINWRINIWGPPANYLNPANHHLVSQSCKWKTLSKSEDVQYIQKIYTIKSPHQKIHKKTL